MNSIGYEIVMGMVEALKPIADDEAKYEAVESALYAINHMLTPYERSDAFSTLDGRNWI